MSSQPSWSASQAQQAVSFSQQQECVSFSQQQQQHFHSSQQKQQQQHVSYSQQQQHTGLSRHQQPTSLTQPAMSCRAPLARGSVSPAAFATVSGQVLQPLQRPGDGHYAALQISASQPMMTPPRPNAYHAPQV